MWVECLRCGTGYDDETRWTICPHNRLDMPADAVLCRSCDVYVGRTNLGTRAPDPDRCFLCGRHREEIIRDQAARP